MSRRVGVSGALAWLAALGVLAACEHAQPFGAPDLGPNEPFSTAFPRQLTFDQQSDLAPDWLPDGSGIIYSFPRGTPDGDRCLAILPAQGGRQTRVICHVPLQADADTTNALWAPAVGPGGALAYVREASLPGALAPSSRVLVVASLSSPDPGRVVLRFPFTASDGVLLGTAASLHWADATTLYFLAEQITYNTLASPVDTQVAPIEVVRVSLAGDSAAVAPVGGTQGVTSFVLAGSDSAFVTLPGDSALYELSLSSGQRAVARVFHSVGAVIDGQHAGGRFFVVAGFSRGRGLGGSVYALDAAPDTLIMLNRQDFVWYQHAAVSPSGALVATEGYSFTRQYVCEGCPTDSIVGRVSTLWLLKGP